MHASVIIYGINLIRSRALLLGRWLANTIRLGIHFIMLYINITDDLKRKLTISSTRVM